MGVNPNLNVAVNSSLQVHRVKSRHRSDPPVSPRSAGLTSFTERSSNGGQMRDVKELGTINDAQSSGNCQGQVVSTKNLGGLSSFNLRMAASPGNSQPPAITSDPHTSVPCLITEGSKICNEPLNIENYKDHFKKYHNGSPRCGWNGCQEERFYKHRLLSHRETHDEFIHIRQKFACDYPGCREKYTRKDRLATHVEANHPGWMKMEVDD
ncbi:hypothetical protein GYMLUDRAFT_68411 [Collybiopsis luxurians FD-317 M1]|nr:hypothetical protein GYMLUDRAFT_68411 [Collybiopsis luxurians FD-317 M1]